MFSRLWHGLVTFCCAITIPDEEQEEVKELLTPALISASLTNDLYSFEKERNDANTQNAVLIVMKEHSCSKERAREILTKRIRIEIANYIRTVKEINARTDLSDDTKRYIDVMQYTLSGNAAWSTQCPRYNSNAQWNELQTLRGKYGVAKYPAKWSPEDIPDGYSTKTDHEASVLNGNTSSKSNGINGHSNGVNGHKRKRNGYHSDGDARTNGNVKKTARISQKSTDALVLEDVVSLALDRNLPDLSDNVSRIQSLKPLSISV